MGLIRYNGFKFFYSVLFLFIISHQCDTSVPFNFEDCESLKDLCEKAKWKLPESDQECMILYYLMKRRYGSDFLQSVYTDTKISLPDDNQSPQRRDHKYWKLFFDEVASRAKHVEPFLVATKMERIPSDNIEWWRVKSFVQPKIKMIVNPDHQNIIRSVMESPLTSTSDYMNAFVNISKLYHQLIPSSRREGVLRYIGVYDNPDNKIAANKITEEFGEDFVQLIKSMVDNSLTVNSDPYWNMFFDKVADLVVYVKPFLKVVKLYKIPTDYAEWETVKSFVKPKMKMIVNPDDRNIIRSVMESPLTSTSDYMNAFVNISKLYHQLIPSSRREGILRYIGIGDYDNPDNEIAANKITEEFGEDFVQLIKSMVDNSLTVNSDPYWNMFFHKVADLVIYVQPFLQLVQLNKIPTDYADWKKVVIFMNDKIETIVIRHDKSKIQSLMSMTYKSKLEYVKAFVKMSKYYFSLIPPSKVDAYLNYFRCSKSDNIKDVVEKVGDICFGVRNVYALSDAVSLGRSFMEVSERLVLMINKFAIEDCKALITKVMILKDCYGLDLKTLKGGDLMNLLQSDIDEFLNSNDNYKASTTFPFSMPSTSKSTITRKVTVSPTSTKVLTQVYHNYMKMQQSPLEEVNSGKRNVAKLSNHYNMCRLMLLTNTPENITNLRQVLEGKTDHKICLAWQMLYEKLCTYYIHEPDIRLEEKITDEEKIEAIKILKIEENAHKLLISIIEMDSRSSQKTTGSID